MTENIGTRTFNAAGTIVRHDRVKLSGADVVVAGSDEAAIGFAIDDATSGNSVGVKLHTRSRTFTAMANEAFAVGASLYGGASGKVQDTDPGVGTIRYTALDAASASGSLVEVLPV